VSGVPQFQPALRDSMRRFTWLVDEFYDRHVNLMLSAETEAERLYDEVHDAGHRAARAAA
jgi:cell division protein ZapE